MQPHWVSSCPSQYLKLELVSPYLKSQPPFPWAVLRVPGSWNSWMPLHVHLWTKPTDSRESPSIFTALICSEPSLNWTVIGLNWTMNWILLGWFKIALSTSHYKTEFSSASEYLVQRELLWSKVSLPRDSLWELCVVWGCRGDLPVRQQEHCLQPAHCSSRSKFNVLNIVMRLV